MSGLRRDARPSETEQSGVPPTGSHDGVEEQLMVVLAVHPGRVLEQAKQVRPAVRRRGNPRRVVRPSDVEIGGRRHGAVVNRRIVVEGHRRNVG